MINETLHRQLNSVQRESNLKPGVHSEAMEG